MSHVTTKDGITLRLYGGFAGAMCSVNSVPSSRDVTYYDIPGEEFPMGDWSTMTEELMLVGKLGYEQAHMVVVRVNKADGVATIACPECNHDPYCAPGFYQLPEGDYVRCNHCKGTGQLFITIN